MEVPSQPSPSAKTFRSVSQAAVAIALGGKLLRQRADGPILVFDVATPPGVRLDDPELSVPVVPLLAWTEALASRVREFNRQQRHGGQR